MATKTGVAAQGRHPLTIATGFLGAFVVASLGVQLIRSASVATSAPAPVQPVIAGQAAMWQVLGER
ncbi:hypothetical protein [Synechococcus sp. W4D4]|uniref:hypothetical protein n=1 Tax=Synechococcus sp. W4D4 TaxID=3392294 RepID=UPI0039ED7857